jgi:hypothetical protein
MKFLMALAMTLVVTSAFADVCKLGGECKVDADCKAVSKDFAVVDGKCIDPKAGETKTDCAGINGTAAMKGSESSGSDKAPGSATSGK